MPEILNIQQVNIKINRDYYKIIKEQAFKNEITQQSIINKYIEDGLKKDGLI